MTNPLGVNDFFVLEAGEYLDRLAALAAGPGAPALDELVRFTRALRGSALMASQHAIGRAASGLEAVARALRDGRRPWQPELGQSVSDAVGQMRGFLRRVAQWTDQDTMEAERLGHQLEELAGVQSGARTAPFAGPRPQPGTGVHAYVAREGASIAGLLDRAATALRVDPAGPDQLLAVVQRMKPLRGLAALTDFPPLPELLDALELTIVELGRREIPAEQGPALLDAGGKALSRAARDVVEAGRPAPEAEEAQRFAGLLRDARLLDGTIVPIASLFYADGRSGVVNTGRPPEPAGPAPSRAELVSRGERLCQIADELARTSAATQRDLRLQAVSRDLRVLTGGVRDELGARLHAFADAALASIARGAATFHPGAFSNRLREAGDLLRTLVDANADPTSLARLADITAAILPAAEAPRLEMPEPTMAPVAVLDDESDVVPIESLLYDQTPSAVPPFAEPPIVPIESLAPTAPLEELPIVPIETLLLAEVPATSEPPAPAVTIAVGTVVTLEADEGNDLAGSFTTYARLVRDLGLGPASLDGLMTGTPAPPSRIPTAAPVLAAVPAPSPQVAPTPVVAPVPVLPAAPAAEVVAEPEAVPIAELCYRGRAALNRAAEVRTQIHQARSDRAPAHTLEPLVEELIDLVGLALVD